MRLKQAFLPALVALLMVASGLFGCRQAGTSAPSQAPQASPAVASSAAGETPKPIKEQMAEDAKAPVTMTITLHYDTPPPDDAPILAEFAKRTGITFKLNAIPGDVHEKLSMMLASKSFTDIMVIPNDQLLTQYKQSDQIIDLLPYLKKDAPSVYGFYSNDANYDMLKYFTEPDGRLLYITNDADLLRTPDEVHEDPNKDADYYFLPWATSLYVLYPDIDKYAGKKITTPDDWYQAMVAYKAKNPDNFATTMCNEYGEWMLHAFAQIYGYQVQTIAGAKFISKDNKTFQSLARLPEALDCMKFLNKLYKEGLMDPEGPLQNMEAFDTKMSSGKVFSFLGWYDQIYVANDALAANDDTKGFMYTPECVKAPGVTQRWEFNTAYLGLDCMMVTKKCPDPDRYFRFLEYLFSDEGQILSGWGIEGEDYVVNAQGKLDMSPEIRAKFDADDSLANNRGRDFWSSVVSTPYHLSDGQYANVYDSPVYQSSEGLSDLMKSVGDSKYNYFRDFKGNYWADPSTLNIVLPENSEESQAVVKIETPLNDLVCKAIVAKSDAEIEQLYHDAMKQFELDGLSKLEKAVQDSIDARRK